MVADAATGTNWADEMDDMPMQRELQRWAMCATEMLLD